MQQNYIFMTDSDSDLPYTIADERNIPVVKMPYAMDGVEYFDDNGRTCDTHDFFQKMRDGASPVTSLLPTAAYLEYFEPILKEHDLLFIAFSSEMSKTIQNIFEAREILLKQYPGRKFMVVDTLNISAPMSLLVLGAHDLYREGKSMEEVAQWVEDNKMRSHAWFTVDDLKYLKRGGRISSTSAFFGTVLDIKPILVMGKGGKIDPADKVQGRKKAVKTLVDKTAEYIEHPEDQEIVIMEADVPEDAKRMTEMLMAKIPAIKSIRVQPVGPVIGAHCGPGTLAVCFMGKKKDI